jgi:hypothetical protein
MFAKHSIAIIIAIIIYIFNIEYGHGLPQYSGFAKLSLLYSKSL